MITRGPPLNALQHTGGGVHNHFLQANSGKQTWYVSRISGCFLLLGWILGVCFVCFVVWGDWFDLEVSKAPRHSEISSQVLNPWCCIPSEEWTPLAPHRCSYVERKYSLMEHLQKAEEKILIQKIKKILSFQNPKTTLRPFADFLLKTATLWGQHTLRLAIELCLGLSSKHMEFTRRVLFVFYNLL